jgi:hypothetical protein
MQGIATRSHGQIHNVVRVQITEHWIGTNIECGIGFFDMKTMSVGVGINGYRFNAHFLACPNNPNRDFTSVCDEYFPDHALTLESGVVGGVVFDKNSRAA